MISTRLCSCYSADSQWASTTHIITYCIKYNELCDISAILSGLDRAQLSFVLCLQFPLLAFIIISIFRSVFHCLSVGFILCSFFHFFYRIGRYFMHCRLSANSVQKNRVKEQTNWLFLFSSPQQQQPIWWSYYFQFRCFFLDTQRWRVVPFFYLYN